MTAELIVDQDAGRTFVHFVLSAYEDGDVSVVGSFNDWVPGVHVLAARADGSRSVFVEVTHPGDIHFRYLGTGGRWFDDPTADVIDEYGSTLRRARAGAAGEPSARTAAAKAPSAKATAKKVAAVKKAAAKKSAAKSTEPAAAKESAKTVAKKAAKKVAEKAAKKVAAKKVAAKKAAKKVAAKKTAKKVAAKKVAKKTDRKAARKATASGQQAEQPAVYLPELGAPDATATDAPSGG